MVKIETNNLTLFNSSGGQDGIRYPYQPTEVRFPELRRFSRDQEFGMDEEGLVIFRLTGQSIKSLKDQGESIIQSEWLEDYPNLGALPSMRSEVAIYLEQIYLPKSERKSLTEQMELVKSLNDRLSEKIPDVKVVIGQLPDYAELFFQLPPKLRLPREPSYPVEVRTTTPVMLSSRGEIYTVAGLRDYGADEGIEIVDGDPNYHLPNIVVVPIVIPSRMNEDRRRRIRSRPLFRLLRDGQLAPKPAQI